MAQQTDPDDSAGDEHEYPRTTPVYAHVADGGMAFCSYDVGNDELERHGVEIERVETEFFSADDADEVIEGLTPEGVRGELGENPPEVGTLTFSEDGIEEIEITLDGLLAPEPGEWPKADDEVERAWSGIRYVFVLNGECLVDEIDMEGVAKAKFIGAFDTTNPRQSFHPYSYSPEAEPVYEAHTPRGKVLIREQDVKELRVLGEGENRD